MNTLLTVQTDIARVQARVHELTGLSPDEQNARMFEAAYEWLESIGCTGSDQTAMTSTRQFWGFFKLEWHKCDLRFINHYQRWEYYLGHAEWYNHFHSVGNSSFIDPHGHGYHQVIKSITR
ncbi:MAG: hypothetical protein ACK5WO_00185 [Cyclobacteriaceae bacterium]|jgi:hypothetical protein|nr:hypothetical protein [Flammeovirgaceae bacterium]